MIGPEILCWGTSYPPSRRKANLRWLDQDTAYAGVKPIVVIVALALSPARAENVHPWHTRVPPRTAATAQGGILTDSLLSREQYIDTAFDQSSAVDFALHPGEIALFNNALIHLSKPNAGSDRRILFLLEMVPTGAWQHSPRESAALVRGQDTHGNFDADRRPQTEMGPAELAAWQRAVEIQASVLFRDAQARRGRCTE